MRVRRSNSLHKPTALTKKEEYKVATVVIPVCNEVTQLDFTAPHQFLSMVPDIKVVVAPVGGRGVSSQGLFFDKLADLESAETCGQAVQPDAAFGSIESVKSVNDLFSLITGRVTAINEELSKNPEKVNADANNIWIIK